MGKANRQRRAEKVRRRKRAKVSSRPPGTRDKPSRSGSGGRPAASEDPWFTPGDRFILAVRAEQSGDAALAARAVSVLAAEPPAQVSRELLEHAETQVGALWEAGWQPADIDRLVAHRLGRTEVRLVRWVIASHAATYEDLGRRAAPAWMDQLERIEARRDWSPDTAYLRQLGGEWPEALKAAVRLMALLTSLPRLPRLVDPPSRWRTGGQVDSATLPPSVLSKVRALLAKAESTTFDAEAEALTAKAQELMTRHRINRALLEAEADIPASRPIPTGRRIAVDDPYADAKAALLDQIADANGCRAVWSKDLGFTTAFGYAEELDAVEELFTSLLVQATMALRREGSKHDRHGRSRTTRFRRSFLVAFATRIGGRLRNTAAATVTAADGDTGTALVPLLAQRDAASERAAKTAFPEMGSFSPTATDGEGWQAGTLFGDIAEISGGGAIEDDAQAA